jgi:hypothetical protein
MAHILWEENCMIDLSSEKLKLDFLFNFQILFNAFYFSDIFVILIFFEPLFPP